MTSEGELYSYACPISDTRQLQVELRRSGEEWEILSWKAVSTLDWESDDDLLLWDGETVF